MKYLYLTQAIHKLKPNALFTFDEPDYAKINWLSLEGDAPTQAEINDAIEQVKADEIAQVEVKAAQKAALLERLGISADEAKLLLA